MDAQGKKTTRSLIAALSAQTPRVERPTGKPMATDVTGLDESLANAEAIAADAGQIVTSLTEILTD
jgi:hypothetical protein